MKQFYAFLFIIAHLPFLAFSQNPQLEWTDDYSFNNAARILKIHPHTGDIILASGEEASNIEPIWEIANYQVLNSLGDEIFDEYLEYVLGDFSAINDVFFGPDGSTYITGDGILQCDILMPALIRKYSPNWNLVWEEEDFVQYAGAGAAFPNGNIVLLLSFGHRVESRSPDGMVLWSADFGEQFIDLSINTNGDLFGLYENGILVLGQNGTIENSTFPDEDLMRIEVVQDSLVIVEGLNQFYIYNSQLDLLAEHNKTAEYSNFAVFQDQIALLNVEGTTARIQIYSSDFQLLDEFDLNFEADNNHEITSLALTNNQIFIGGRIDFFHGSSLFFKSFDLMGNAPQSSTDASINESWANSPPKQRHESWNGQHYYYSNFEDVYVTIQNQGDNLLNSLNINLAMNIGEGYCPYVWNRNWELYNLNLEPNESLDVSLGGFEIYEGQNPIMNKELCFYITIPNHELDIDLSNNVLCNDFVISDIEEVPEEATFHISPNPVSDQLQIFNELGTKGSSDITIFNAQGQKVFEEKNWAGIDYQLNVSQYPTGTYFLKIDNPKDSFFAKFIKF